GRPAPLALQRGREPRRVWLSARARPCPADRGRSRLGVATGRSAPTNRVRVATRRAGSASDATGALVPGTFGTHHRPGTHTRTACRPLERAASRRRSVWRERGATMTATYVCAADALAGWRDDVLSGKRPLLYPVGTGELARIEIGPGTVTLLGGAPGAG